MRSKEKELLVSLFAGKREKNTNIGKDKHWYLDSKIVNDTQGHQLLVLARAIHINHFMARDKLQIILVMVVCVAATAKHLRWQQVMYER